MRPRTLIALAASFFLFVLVPVAFAQGGDPGRGGGLYVENCAVCHGLDGQGRIGASLEDFPGIDAGTSLEAVIAAGVPGSVMPAWGEANGGPLSAQEIRDIAAYILAAFGGTQPITPLPTYQPPSIPSLPDVEGDPSAGAVVYHTNCVMCHGDQGQGRLGLPLAKAWPMTEPAVYIQQVVRDGIDGTTMPAWAQARGGPLSDQSISDVAAFVLTLEPPPSPTPIPETTGPMSSTATWLLLAALAVVVIVVVVVYLRRPRTG